MAKPIFLMRVQYEDDVDFNKLKESISDQLKNEYHVLIIVEVEFPELIKCECFNSDKITPIEIDELKKIINNKNHGN